MGHRQQGGSSAASGRFRPMEHRTGTRTTSRRTPQRPGGMLLSDAVVYSETSPSGLLILVVVCPARDICQWQSKTAHLWQPRIALQFLTWCEGRGLRLEAVSPLHVAAYIRTHPGSTPTVKQHLVAIRMLCDWLVVSQVLPVNPAAAVRGPKHVVTKGATPVLSPAAARKLLEAIADPEGCLNVAGACSAAAADCSRSRWTMAAGSARRRRPRWTRRCGSGSCSLYEQPDRRHQPARRQPVRGHEPPHRRRVRERQPPHRRTAGRRPGAAHPRLRDSEGRAVARELSPAPPRRRAHARRGESPRTHPG